MERPFRFRGARLWAASEREIEHAMMMIIIIDCVSHTHPPSPMWRQCNNCTTCHAGARLLRFAHCVCMQADLALTLAWSVSEDLQNTCWKYTAHDIGCTFLLNTKKHFHAGSSAATRTHFKCLRDAGDLIWFFHTALTLPPIDALLFSPRMQSAFCHLSPSFGEVCVCVQFIIQTEIWILYAHHINMHTMSECWKLYTPCTARFSVMRRHTFHSAIIHRAAITIRWYFWQRAAAATMGIDSVMMTFGNV